MAEAAEGEARYGQSTSDTHTVARTAGGSKAAAVRTCVLCGDTAGEPCVLCVL
jgi:hypothetical protein